MNCCEVNMAMGNIVQQAADPQHTHTAVALMLTAQTLCSPTSSQSVAPGRATLRDYPDPGELTASGAHNGSRL